MRTKSSGFVVPNLELSAMCHPQFKPGPPSEMAQTASFFLHEVIQNSKIIDLKNLCIQPGTLVWAIYADLKCLNYGGNILDTAIKALCAALLDMKLPQVEIEDKRDPEGEVIKLEENEVKIDMQQKYNFKLSNEIPYSCTIAVFDGDKLLVDPTEEEEKLSDASVTVVVQVT